MRLEKSAQPPKEPAARWKLDWVTWGFVVLVVLVVGLMMSGSLRRSSHITLPPPDESQGQAPEDNPSAVRGPTVIEVTPGTVQAAIGSLARPEAYRRTVKVEQLWTGGSGIYETAVTTAGPWTRTDRTIGSGHVRHTITGEDRTYIWYDGDSAVYEGPAGGISADAEQSIPTYEDILELPTEHIVTADYRTLSGLNCIYVETAEDRGYVLRYWVNVDTGLLVAAEKLLNGNTVYRMGAPSLELIEEPSESDFALPDGRVLLGA
ncbi:MAG: hypothetical protein HFF90_02505 [Oscillibacter sp.]|nr:hypothetical protein [Oscillibacter sp.]